MKKNFSKVQKTLHIFANVFGFCLTAKEMKFATLGVDREAKRALWRGRACPLWAFWLNNWDCCYKIKLLLSPVPSTQVFPFHPRPQPSPRPTDSCCCSQRGTPGSPLTGRPGQGPERRDKVETQRKDSETERRRL